ncbi:hypothetical protein GCM10007907_16900 [Chitinimonas prasina]|uniref:Uncharacterized protein n=1 Tax=Chitinimonas prasina TaxID=1434937 RepID=A0ABQ5YD79_9NEIS|nr:hypothetical protein GCM10007907_16900 [Chitinimonas prasina]
MLCPWCKLHVPQTNYLPSWRNIPFRLRVKILRTRARYYGITPGNLNPITTLMLGSIGSPPAMSGRQR